MMLPDRYLVLLLALCLSGCSHSGYYAQAVRGQWEILTARQNVQQLINNPDTPQPLRQQLTRAQAMRDFAITELGLPQTRAYTTFAQLDRQYVVWNVLAAPAFDITPKTWCFPVAGCVAYKGYFSPTAAQAQQQALQHQGYDTFLYGVSAYSTLGWFADPILDTFIDYPEVALAALLFHEMAHQVVYVKDDSAFNEAFATAVERAGVEHWLRQTATPDAVADYLSITRRNDRIIDLLLEFRNRLAQAYRDTPEPARQSTKQKMFATLKQRYAELQKQGQGTPYFDAWFTRDLNNAHLASISTYHQLAPAFTHALNQAGSFPAFYNLITDKAALPKAEREQWLQQLLRKP